MMTETFVNSMANGTIAVSGQMMPIQDIDWARHPTFAGVYLKHLIRGEHTNGQLSCHMVKIDPGCTLETHTHAEQWELHEVIGGEGLGMLEEKALSYKAGQITVIPCGTPHAVTAGDQGLVLLAKFFPALL